MRLIPLLLLSAATAPAIDDPVPEVFAPGVVSRGAHEAAPTFSPDGATLYFQRSTPDIGAIMTAHRRGDGWSRPVVAPFSGGGWTDMEPAMAPDGSFMIFVSNRPTTANGKVLDGHFGGKLQPGGGGNLWRVARIGRGWGVPERLPEAINAGTSVFAPSVVRDGSLYFMRPDPASGRFRLYRSQWRDGDGYQSPVPLPFSTGATTDVDPAVDPDERYMVFGSGRAPAADMDLFLVRHAGTGWGTPRRLAFNAKGSDAEPRLSPDRRWLYFSSERIAPAGAVRGDAIEAAAAWNNGLYNIWRVPLAPLLAGG